jgi:hypothetical protein
LESFVGDWHFSPEQVGDGWVDATRHVWWIGRESWSGRVLGVFGEVVKAGSISRRLFGDCEVYGECGGSVVESVGNRRPRCVHVRNGRPGIILS